MQSKSKLAIWYSFLIALVVALSTLVYLVMSRIEADTSNLESYIQKRNLGYIADKPYEAEKILKRDDTVKALNSLTDFFVSFHDNTIMFKDELESFMANRKKVLERFNSSSIETNDMSVVPNSEISNYVMRLKYDPEGSTKLYNYSKQYPFTRELFIDRSSYKHPITTNSYFLCSARVALTAGADSVFHAGFIEGSEKIEPELFMPHTVFKDKPSVFNVNRIIKMPTVRKSKISIRGHSEAPLKIERVEAFCVNFNDIE